MAEPVENLHLAYQVLERNVIRALQTQPRDSVQLTIQVNEVLRFLQAAEQHRAAVPPSEYATLQQSITAMVQQLDQTLSSIL
ncbi:hypothetical protein B0H14DRAFT_3521082 [Mycena olivaceomarginata]|nr:hypothetical protein B0H14DRAFT_3521082 [Mycena olivaceomarginata]